MKPLKLLAILSLTIALAIPLTSCDNDDNDSPTPPSTSGDNTDKDIELEDIPCINQSVSHNGVTMYNVLPDLDQFNSWWNSDKAQYWKNLNTKTFFLLQRSSNFRLNRGEEASGILIRLRKNATTWYNDFAPVGNITMSFYGLRDAEGRVASPDNLSKNQEITCGTPEFTLIIFAIQEYDFKSTTYYCKVEGGHILFDNYDPRTGVVTVKFDNVTLKETNIFGGTLENEPRQNVINGTVSLIYYDDYE